eukprot:1159560-Pelagomonas_calceolata.AAC.1
MRSASKLPSMLQKHSKMLQNTAKCCKNTAAWRSGRPAGGTMARLSLVRVVSGMQWKGDPAHAHCQN